jgi:hypothetical protein
MRIITHTCNECGTVVAANELERRRIMKCPERHCEEVLRFDELPQSEQEFFIKHRSQYQI